MTTADMAADLPSADLIAPDLFSGPPRLRRLISLLRVCPAPVAEHVLAALAVVDGITRRGRYRRAAQWATDQGLLGWARQRTALGVLANHGRFVAEEALLGVRSTCDLARDIVLLGQEHLNAQTRGALLIGFHLGPPKTWLRLRATGYPVRFAGRLAGAARDPRWEAVIAAGAVIRLPDGDSRSRLRSLFQMRRLLEDGSLIYVTADGPFGREAFRVELPGNPVIVRTGWLALRRATGVPTLPVLTWRESRRRVIHIHPPLPTVDADPDRDAAACQAALTPLIADYVRRHPTQCRWVAMPRWPDSSVDPGTAQPADHEVAAD